LDVNFITDEELSAVMPLCPADVRAAYLPHLNEAMADYGITTAKRVAAFLAQLAHGSVQLQELPGSNERVGCHVAARIWHLLKLNDTADLLTLSDRIADELAMKAITRKLTGGLNGFADRMTYYKRAVRVLLKRETDDTDAQLRSPVNYIR
jgi:predicted chitinase